MALYSIVLQVGISSDRIAGMAQSVERRIGSAEVTGPIPVASLTGKKAVILDFSKGVTAFSMIIQNRIKHINIRESE